MLKRSLQLYANAFTCPDATAYLAVTPGARDARNFQAILLDAALRPRLEPHDFAQEGHHIGVDADGELVRKGVVFNEMKGALADASSLFSEEVTANLYTRDGSCYSVNSGGDPKDIPRLTHEHLRAYHAMHYSPEAMRAFVVAPEADLPDLLNDMDAVLRTAMEERSAEPVSTAAVEGLTRVFPDGEERWDAPRSLTVTGPPSLSGRAPADDNRVSLTWLTKGSVTDSVFEVFALRLLSTLLFDAPSGPAYRALLSSGLGASFSPMSGYYPQYFREAPFSIGVQAVTADKVDQVEPAILKMLAEVAETGGGLDVARVRAEVYQMEVGLAHRTPLHGLQLFWSVLPHMMYTEEPFAAFDILEHMAELNKQLDSQESMVRFFGDLIRRHFLDNPHRLLLTQTVDPEYSAKRDEAEATAFRAEVDALSEEEVAAKRAFAAKVAEAQNSEPNFDCLPSLQVDVDVPQTVPDDDVDALAIPTNARSKAFAASTSGLQYAQVFLSSEAAEQEQGTTQEEPAGLSTSPLLPLATSLVSRLGTSRHTDAELSVLLDSTFGDFSISPFRSLAAKGLMVHANWLVDRRSIADATDLLVHVLTDTKTSDAAAASTILRQANESAQESLVGSGHRYAMSLARAALPNAHALDAASERWSGLTQMRMLQRLAEADDQSLAPQAVALAQSLLVPSLASRLVGPSEAQTLEAAAALESALTTGLAGVAEAARSQLRLDSGVLALAHEELRLPEARHALLVRHELPVNYVARAIRAVPYSHPDYAALKVASKVLNVRLHALIREQGGAYGAGSNLAQSGSFAYFSYRDPSSTGTLDAFTRATQDYAAGGAFTDRDLHEAKLSLFAEVDAPQPTSAKGAFTFATGLTHADLEAFRARVFAITRDDVRRVAADYLAEPKEVTNVIIGTVDVGEEQWDLV